MKVRANAKVNLSLDITGRRADGYHNIRSVMQSVSLCDIIELSSGDSINLVCNKNELSGCDNLAFKAAGLFFEESRVNGGVNIKIEKHIPVAGGLGGGSADAAAVLWALNEMYGRPFCNERMLGLALRLGADVPFCLHGGTVLAEGIGEELTKLPNLPDCLTVIAKKGVKSSTKDMYRAIDNEEPAVESDIDGIVFGLINGDLISACRGFCNRFEDVAEKGVLCECKAIMNSNSCLYAGLSGAGPSVVGIFKTDDYDNAETAVAELKSRGFEVYLSRPSEFGVEIIE